MSALNSLYLKNPKQTHDFGIKLSRTLTPGMVLLLYGPLGAGKTTLARGIAEGLGIEDGVTSPTYTLVNEYRGRLDLYHMDLYRLSGPEDFDAIGGEDYLSGQGVCLIEWPERLEESIPPQAVKIHLSLEGEGRRISWEGIEV